MLRGPSTAEHHHAPRACPPGPADAGAWRMGLLWRAAQSWRNRCSMRHWHYARKHGRHTGLRCLARSSCRGPHVPALPFQRPVGRAGAASCSRAGADRGQAHVRGRRPQRRAPDRRVGLQRRHPALPHSSAGAPPHRGPDHPVETADHHRGDSRRPGRARPLAVDGAGDRPGQELGAHRVHGPVRRGHAPAGRLHKGWHRAVPHHRAGLAGRRRRGVAAVAPGFQRVLPAAGKVMGCCRTRAVTRNATG